MKTLNTVNFPHSDYITVEDVKSLLEEVSSNISDLESDIEEKEAEIEGVEDHLSESDDLSEGDIDELQSDLEVLQSELEEMQSDLEKLQSDESLLEYFEDIDSCETLISEHNFKDYCEELCGDCYDMRSIPDFIKYHIDWKGVTNDMRSDYSEIEIEGKTYLYR